MFNSDLNQVTESVQNCFNSSMKFATETADELSAVATRGLEVVAETLTAAKKQVVNAGSYIVVKHAVEAVYTAVATGVGLFFKAVLWLVTLPFELAYMGFLYLILWAVMSSIEEQEQELRFRAAKQIN